MRAPTLEPSSLLADVERISALGPRFCGTPGEERCRDLLLEEFERAGLSGVRTEGFPYLAYLPGWSECRANGGEPLRCTGLQGSASGRAGGEAISLGSGTAEELAEAEREGIDLAGRVVVVETDLVFTVATLLRDRGIAALVQVCSTPDRLLADFTATFYPPPLEPPWPGRVLPFPGVAVEAQAGRRLLAALERAPTTVAVEHRAAYEQRVTANVIGEIAGGQAPEQRVVVGAHYDSQLHSPGASDNATGLAALLALARGWSRRNPRRTVALVAFAAEELACWGACVHARGCDPELTAGMVNFDALGPPLPARRTVVRTPGIARLAAEAAQATGWQVEAEVEAASFPFADHAPFADAGIEACMLWRYPPAHPYYHSPGDLPDFVDAQRLAEDARAGAAVAAALADGSEPIRRAAAPDAVRADRR